MSPHKPRGSAEPGRRRSRRVPATTGTADTQAFLRKELAAIAKRTRADYGFIGVIEVNRGTSYVVIRDRFRRFRGAEIGDWQTQRPRFKVGGDKLPPDDRSFCGHVAFLKQPRCAPDVTREPFYHPGNTDTRSEVAVPVLFHGDVLAVLNLESKKTSGFSPRVVRLLTKWADRIGEALHRQMVRDGLRSRQRRVDEREPDPALRLVRTLHGLLNRLNASLAELRLSHDRFRTETLEAEALDAAEVLGTDVLTLYPFDADTQEFEIPPICRGMLHHPEVMANAIYPGDAPWTIVHQGSQYWRDVQRVPHLTAPIPERDGTPARERFVSREGIRSACGLRLEVGGIPSGVLFLSFRTYQAFEAQHRELIATYAGHLSFVLELARVHRQLRAAASHQERTFLDMELHAGALYGLTIANVACATAKEEIRAGRFTKALDALSTVEGAIVHTNEEIADLRTSLQMPSLEVAGLIGTLTTELGLVLSPPLDVSLPMIDPPVDLPAKHAIRKIVQTAVRNIIQHSGASCGQVTLRCDAGEVQLVISDDGRGFDVASARTRSGRHGIVDIEHRVESLKGTVHIQSAPGSGTTITASIPIPSDASARCVP